MTFTEITNVYEAYNRLPYIQNAVNNAKTEDQFKAIKKVLAQDNEVLTGYIDMLADLWKKEYLNSSIYNIDTRLQLLEKRRQFLNRRELLSKEMYVVNDILTLYEIKRQIKEGT